MSEHLRGLLYAFAGVIALSPDALLVRLVQADHWALLSLRYLFFCAVMLLLMAWQRMPLRRTLRLSLCWPQLGYALGVALSGSCFVFALTHTLAANALMMISAAPLFGALISAIWLRERLLRSTWLAIAVCTLGLGGIIGGSAEFAGATVLGDVAALGVALGLAGNAVLARRYREVDMTPGLLSGGLLGALIGAAFGDFSSVQPTDYGWLFLQGGVCVALAYLLLSRAPRYIPAPEVSLIMLLESFLGPFWVWLLLAEVPPSSTIYGGLLVLTTMVLYTLSRLHGARRAAQLRKAPVA